ncbi:MAG: hypothetical protein AUG46_04775 [Acidobacteria bacterium 13_1_20CM_3_58_11]|nr:MAG: hypothetical protein AUG46_04775 [Acidobacteria bacterium 13_1_20CM_3_58_11]
MSTWIALFRGINVMGSNSLPMKDLAALLQREGFADVRTYIQSGNAVFRSAARSANSLASRIGRAVHRAKGLHPRVVVLSVKELQTAVSNNPFPKAESQPKTLHLFFLSEEPLRADLASLNRLRSGREAFALRGKVFYLHTPDGFAVSKLAANAERHVHVDATARNWNTVTKLLEMANGDD